MRELWENIVKLLTEYGIVRILVAILVLFAGWIIAWILRELTFKCVRKCRIGERLRLCMSEEAAPAVRVEDFAGRIVFWIVFLFAVRIAVLFFAGVAALTTEGIGGTAALLAFGIVLGAFAVAFAIAFVLGGRSFAERKLEEWDREHSGTKHKTE